MAAPRRINRARRAALSLLVALAASPAAAGAPRTEAEAAGPWMLAQGGGNRACGLNLGIDAAPGGRALRYPAGCRRALPILAGVSAWTFGQGAIHLLGPDGRIVLALAPTPEGALAGRAASGEAFTLAALPRDDAPAANARPAADPLALPPAVAVARASIDPALAVPSAAMVGLYAVDRFVERDTCRIQLRPADASGRGEAAVPEGCRDGGLALFDPVAWRSEAGRLTLVARRGHEVALVPMPGGRWRRDPETGTTLILRRIEP